MKKIILSAIVFVGAMTLNAQDEAPKLSVSGTVDAYYRANLLNSLQMMQPVLLRQDLHLLTNCLGLLSEWPT